MRPRSITSKDRVKPRWPLKFVRTCSPTDRMLRRKTLGPQHVWARIGIGSPIPQAEGSRRTLSPLGATHVQVEESPDSYTVPAPVDAGDTFVAVVRGRGLRVNATALPSLTYMYWDRRTKSRGGSHRPPLRDHAAAADADNTRLCWRTVTGVVDRPA